MLRSSLALSLVEVLVTVAILALLAALLSPALVNSKRFALMSVDTAHLRQIGAASELYRADTDDRAVLRLAPLVAAGAVPLAIVVSPLDTTPEGLGVRLHSRDQTMPNPPDYRQSYVAVGDVNGAEWIEATLARARGFGWLASLSNGMPVSIEEGLFPRGPILRLTPDGAVLRRVLRRRQASDGSPVFRSYDPFVDEEVTRFE